MAEHLSYEQCCGLNPAKGTSFYSESFVKCVCCFHVTTVCFACESIWIDILVIPFQEDGIETNNRYIGNLGIVTRGSSSLLNTDQIPATFWITNPRNTFIGNAAVASRGFGYWYDLDRFPSGASYTSTVCPNREPFGQFRDNTAHTCNEFGLRIWEEYTPFEDGCRRGAPANATFYNFTTYNNGIHGVEFSVIGHVTVDHFKIADNVEMGFEIQEANGLWGEAVIKVNLLVM